LDNHNTGQEKYLKKLPSTLSTCTGELTGETHPREAARPGVF
jgi:hypothetical protein